MRKIKKSLIRHLSVLAVFLAACVGVVFNVGSGTLSSFGLSPFGWDIIATICPLGVIEAMLATKLLIPSGLIVLLVVALSHLILGKYFCSWVCPVPGLRNIIDAIRKRTPVKEAKHTKDTKRAESKRLESTCEESKCCSQSEGDATIKDVPETCALCTSRKAGITGKVTQKAHKSAVIIDSRHLVLGGSLLSAVVFGFPVFCLICPVGLTFATVIVLTQLFSLQTLSWGLLLFPLILVLEVTVLRKWCAKFCPLGALASLLSLPNRLFRPRVNTKKCLNTKGIECQICSDICPEGLDPHSSENIHECTKCKDCAINCPANAITFYQSMHTDRDTTFVADGEKLKKS